MAIERVLNGVEHIHRFTRAVSVGNPREFLQVEKQEQEMAQACKQLIKNCIICWNCLYLSQKLVEMDDPAHQEAILSALTMVLQYHGSMSTFWESMIFRRSGCGIRSVSSPQNCWTKQVPISGAAESPKVLQE